MMACLKQEHIVLAKDVVAFGNKTLKSLQTTKQLHLSVVKMSRCGQTSIFLTTALAGTRQVSKQADKCQI